MSDRPPVIRDCFRARKGLCVEGDAHVDGDLTVTGDVFFDANGLILAEGEICQLSACRIYSANDFGDPLSAADHTIFEQELTVLGDTTTYVIHAKDDITGDQDLVISGYSTLGDDTRVSGTLVVQDDVHFHKNLIVDGNVTFNADNVDGSNIIYLGDENTDNVVFRADVDSDIVPDNDLTYMLGSSTQRWHTLHVSDISAAGDVHITGDLTVDGNAWLSAGVTGVINIGDNSDDSVTINADVASDILPDQDLQYNLGDETKRWKDVHVQTLYWSGGDTTQLNQVVTNTQTNSATQDQVNTAVESNSSKWFEPVVDVMTRSATQITTPSLPTGDTHDFNPSHLETAAWYDMSDTNTLIMSTSSTPSVSAVLDKSGNNHTLSQDTLIECPAVSTINGLTGLLFDGVDDVLQTTPNATTPLGTQGQPLGDLTVFVMYRVEDNTVNGFLIHQGGGQYLVVRGPWGNNVCSFDVGQSGTNKTRVTVPGWSSPGEIMIASFTVKQGGLQQIWRDGVSVGSDNTAHNPNVGDRFSLGGVESYTTDQHCTIGEVIIFNEELDELTRTRVEGYLAHKWGTSITLAETGYGDDNLQPHPFRSTTPKLSSYEYQPEFFPMQTNISVGDSVWEDVNYDHAMVLPYDTRVKRVMLRCSASQGSEIKLSMHSNRDETDPNTIDYKFFPRDPIEIQTQTFSTNNEPRVYTFTPGASAGAGKTFGMSVSADHVINHVNASIVLEYLI